jgi:hypothetical protein
VLKAQLFDNRDGDDSYTTLNVRGIVISLSVACLRVQLSDAVFNNYSNKKAIGEFIIGSLLLYLSCLCLIG